MLVIEIDYIDLESPEAGFARRADIVGFSVYAKECAVGCADVPKLSGQEDFFTP